MPTIDIASLIIAIGAIITAVATAVSKRHEASTTDDTTAVAGFNALCTQLQGRITIIDGQIKELEERNRQQEAHAAALADDVARQADVLAQAVREREDRIIELERHTADLEERVKRLKIENETLQGELTRLRQENEELRTLLDAMKRVTGGNVD